MAYSNYDGWSPSSSVSESKDAFIWDVGASHMNIFKEFSEHSPRCSLGLGGAVVSSVLGQ